MNNSDVKRLLLDLARQEGNRTCIDCGALNPQWASVNLAIYFCLECSGQHRSLGVHLSFVRSLTMDKWTEEQVKKMQFGGNEKAKAFLSKQSNWNAKASIKDKYTSRAAQNYREKLIAEFEGRSWVPSSDSPLSISSRKDQSFSNAALSKPSSAPSLHTFYPLPNKAETETWFEKKVTLNSNKPENVPPSQGGKYAGFGSEPSPSFQSASIQDSKQQQNYEDFFNNTMNTLSAGWSLFSQTVGNAAIVGASTLQKKIIEPTTEAIRDPSNIREQILDFFTSSSSSASPKVSQLSQDNDDFYSTSTLSATQSTTTPLSTNNTVSIASSGSDFLLNSNGNLLPKRSASSSQNLKQTKKDEKDAWDDWE